MHFFSKAFSKELCLSGKGPELENLSPQGYVIAVIKAELLSTTSTAKPAISSNCKSSYGRSGRRRGHLLTAAFINARSGPHGQYPLRD